MTSANLFRKGFLLAGCALLCCGLFALRWASLRGNPPESKNTLLQVNPDGSTELVKPNPKPADAEALRKLEKELKDALDFLAADDGVEDFDVLIYHESGEDGPLVVDVRVKLADTDAEELPGQAEVVETIRGKMTGDYRLVIMDVFFKVFLDETSF